MEKIVYNGSIITVREEKIQGKRYEKAFFLPSVHIFPILPEGKILFIREHRWETNQSRLLVPSGLRDRPEESAIQTAKRELEEEIAYTTNTPLEHFQKLSRHGTINIERDYFLARDLQPIPNQFPEKNIREIVPLTPKEMWTLVCNGGFGTSESVPLYIQLYNNIQSHTIVL